MKLSFTAALAIGLSLAVSTQAAPATPKPAPAAKRDFFDRVLRPFGGRATPVPIPTETASRAAGKPKKAPPKRPGSMASKMIVIPPPTDAVITGGEPPKLISSEMSGKDLQFFMQSVEAGRIQAYLVQLLETRAASDQIKALGSALATTQEQENRQITRLAAAKGWTVTTEPTAAEKAVGAKLEKLAGQDFDKAVMDQVVAMAQQSVTAYEEAAQSNDPEIKEFSVQMLPLARQKLKYAEKMTGAGKEATQLFRTGAPSKSTPATKPAPPAITPSKSKAPTATKESPGAAKPAPVLPPPAK
jgi:putative membrane protein